MSDRIRHYTSPGAVYVLGLIGSAVYFLQQASGAGEIIAALLKALIWPALLAYYLFKLIGA